jgi:eukaryotic-like serine/threonine-protein kinase
VPSWSQPVGACVGSGGFASVWSIPGGVLKVAHADHDLARAQIAREAHALAAVGSPWVPRLDDHGVLADGRAWIAMERVPGPSLGELLAVPIALDRALEIAVGLLDSLGHVHAAGFVHRDLKPDNLVIRADRSVAILDLGLARKLPTDDADPTRPGVQVGSLEYIAPEQLRDPASVDARSDLYAFGCVLYELCAGRPPFLGDDGALRGAHQRLRPPALSALAEVPTVLEAVCHDCLAKQPTSRPPSALAVRRRISAVREDSSRAPGHAVSMVSEGKQPVVLLWAELPRVDRALLGALAARKISVISQRGRRVLGGVVGAEHADPAGAAIAAARELAAAGARVALHLDALQVQPRLAGAAVERPETWLPAAPWVGVALTRALATVTQAPTRPSELGPGFVMLADAGAATELFGRDALIAELVGDAAAALGAVGPLHREPGPPGDAELVAADVHRVARLGPGFALIVGDHGTGKTALAGALAAQLRALGARVHSGTIPPPGSERPGHSALGDLIGTLDGPIVRAVGDALRAAARARPLAIILDEVHLADHELLDALEYATLGGEPVALWIVALAAPRIDQRRPGLGNRAERHRRDSLGPLDADAAVALTAALLRPAEYPPLRALRQIVAIAHGHPLHLMALAREIHDRGAIRVRPNGEHFLDTTALDALPPLALGPWLAARELAGLAGELIALARVCAILGDEFARGEIAAVVELVERRGGATTPIDVDVGLAELVAARVLVRFGAGWAFRQALLQDGVYATTNEDERRTLHRAALDIWCARPLTEPSVAERVARHAEAVGEIRIAARAFATLGERAHRAHRPLEADQAWQGALRNLADPDLGRGRALLGRARARYRLQRVRDALADLEEALGIALALGDARLEIEALLEQATALDWSDDYAGSAAIATRAALRCAEVGDPELAPEIALAEARVVFRKTRAAAAPALAEVVAAAHRAGHAETETIARLLLGPALIEGKQLDDAEAVFDELIALCEKVDDTFHLSAAYANRMLLWAALGRLDRVELDRRTVIQLAREGGHATVERNATHNLAEDRLWQGALDEAERLARRCLSLQRGHGEGSTAVDELLLARIMAAKGDLTETRSLVTKLIASDLAGAERIMVELLRCYVERAPPAEWAVWLDRANLALGDELRLEFALLAQRADDATKPPEQPS